MNIMPMMIEESTLVHATTTCGGCSAYMHTIGKDHPIWLPPNGLIDTICGIKGNVIAYWYQKDTEWEINCLLCTMGTDGDGDLTAGEAKELEVAGVLTGGQRV